MVGRIAEHFLHRTELLNPPSCHDCQLIPKSDRFAPIVRNQNRCYPYLSEEDALVRLASDLAWGRPAPRGLVQ